MQGLGVVYNGSNLEVVYPSEYPTGQSKSEANDDSYKGMIQLFFTYSSSSSLLGLSRSSHYAAANGFFNEQMPWRKKCGLQHTNVLWGEINLGMGGRPGPHELAQQVQEAWTEGAAFKLKMKLYENVLLGGPSPKKAVTEKQALSLLAQMPEKRAKPPTKPEEEPVRGKDPEDAPIGFENVVEASGDIRVVHTSANDPLELQLADPMGFSPVGDLHVKVRTKEANDRVLLACSVPMACLKKREVGSQWAFQRGEERIGPLFGSYTDSTDTMLMSWLDKPGESPLDEVAYSLNVQTEGDAAFVSREGQTRHLTAIAIPGTQITSKKDERVMTVGTDRWYNVPGFDQMTMTAKGERVLVLGVVTYTALWDDPGSRAVFRIGRDAMSIDLGLGVQSVRTQERNRKRTVTIALIDDPAPGLHLYHMQAMVTTEHGKLHELRFDDDIRQFALIRFPDPICSGPSKPISQGLKEAFYIEEEKWVEVPGLVVTASTSNAGDKVLVAYNTTMLPTTARYEVYFTLFRYTSGKETTNLGHEELGMICVSSDFAASSEFPIAMFVDLPGKGIHTYTVFVRTKQVNSGGSDSNAVWVGPDGRISAILLPGQEALGDQEKKAEWLAQEAKRKADEKGARKAAEDEAKVQLAAKRKARDDAKKADAEARAEAARKRKAREEESKATG